MRIHFDFICEDRHHTLYQIQRLGLQSQEREVHHQFAEYYIE